MALIVLNNLGRGRLVGAYHGAQVFRVKLAGELRGAHQVAKQHRELPPFCLRRARGEALGAGQSTGAASAGALAGAEAGAPVQISPRPASSTTSGCA